MQIINTLGLHSSAKVSLVSNNDRKAIVIAWTYLIVRMLFIKLGQTKLLA